MISYSQKKEEVLKQHRKFLKTSSALIEEKLLTPQLEALAENIREQAARVKEDRFLLMLVGESKSGKSTLINALLCQEVLPADVLECTSSVVEISYGEQCEVLAHLADKTTQSILGEENARGYLQANAAINPAYEGLPTPLIDQELLIASHGNPISEDIDRLIKETTGSRGSLTPEEYDRRVRGYIDSRKQNWQQIPVHIELRWPLDPAVRNMHVIDSPGVNTRGVLGDVTEDYLRNADAIIFCKQIGTATRSTGFLKFLSDHAANMRRDMLFLVLTHAADWTNGQVAAACSAAQSEYSVYLDEKHILAVDSLTQVVLNHCLRIPYDADVGSYLSSQTDQGGNFYGALELDWMRSQNDRNAFRNRLEMKSRFDILNKALETFGRQAHVLALEVLLTDMGKFISAARAILEDRIHLFAIGQQSLEELLMEITRRKEELEQILFKLNQTLEGIEREYNGGTDDQGNTVEGIIEDERKFRAEQFRKAIKQAEEEENFQILGRAMSNTEADMESFRQTMKEELLAKCDEQLKKLTEDEKSQIPFETMKPTFSSDKFDKLVADTKENSSVIEQYMVRVGKVCPHWVVKQHSVYSLDRHLKTLANILSTQLDTISNRMAKGMRDYVVNLLALYRKELEKRFDQLRNEYNDMYRRLIATYCVYLVANQYGDAGAYEAVDGRKALRTLLALFAATESGTEEAVIREQLTVLMRKELPSQEKNIDTWLQTQPALTEEEIQESAMGSVILPIEVVKSVQGVLDDIMAGLRMYVNALTTLSASNDATLLLVSDGRDNHAA